jgi:glycosyltransferase involved in cell wall biosynthesis
MTRHLEPDRTRRPSVVIVAAFFPPWGGGGVLRMTKLVKFLPSLGWDVTVICSDERHPEVVDETLLLEIPPEVRVIRRKGPFRSIGGAATGVVRAGAGRRVMGPLLGLAKAMARALLIPDRWIGWAIGVGGMPVEALHADVVLSSGPPHSAHLAASRLARRLGAPHVVDLRDDWGGNPLHAHPVPWHGPMDRLLERRILRRAAHVVTIYETSARRLALRRPELADRVSDIPNGFDPEDLEGIAPRRARAPGSTVSFLFAGSLRGTQQAGRFFEVFGSLVREREGAARLTLLGFISPTHEAQAREQIPASALDVRPAIAHRPALEAMATADVLVVLTGGGGAGADTITGKIFEYLALRRPVLVIGPPGPARELVQRVRGGTAASPDDAPAIKEALELAMRMATDPTFDGASPGDLEPLNRRLLARHYSALLSAVSSNQASRVVAH